jgi:hypothetical protein
MGEKLPSGTNELASCLHPPFHLQIEFLCRVVRRVCHWTEKPDLRMEWGINVKDHLKVREKLNPLRVVNQK